MSFIAPYAGHSAPQGNLMGALQAFLANNVAASNLAEDRGIAANTRQQLNAENGWGNVDPFAVQRFAGEDQRQSVVGDTNKRAQETHGWKRDDRTQEAQFIEQYLNNIRGLGPQQDPLVGAALGAGNSPQAANVVQQFLSGDRTAAQNRAEWDRQNAVTFGQKNFENALDNEAALQRVMEMQKGQDSSINRQMQMYERKKADEAALVAEFIRTGDNSKLPVELMDNPSLQTRRQEHLWNQQQQQLAAEKEALRKQMINGGGQNSALGSVIQLMLNPKNTLMNKGVEAVTGAANTVKDIQAKLLQEYLKSQQQ